VRLASINTPGSLLLVDDPSHRFVTTDYTTTRTTADSYAGCQAALGPRGMFDYQTHACVKVDRTFKLVDVVGTKATLRQTMIPPAQNIGGVHTTDDRIYVTRYAEYQYPTSCANGCVPTVLELGGLWAIGGIREGNLRIVSRMDGDANWPVAARGTKVALSNSVGLAIYDTASATPSLVAEAKLRGWGYSSHVLLGDDRAICSLGEFGLQTLHY
jgi:hypothetical protein